MCTSILILRRIKIELDRLKEERKSHGDRNHPSGEATEASWSLALLGPSTPASTKTQINQVDLL